MTEPVGGHRELARRWTATHDAATRVTPPGGDYLIVAPHPDDEALVVGGLVSRLTRSGSLVSAICVTDGGNAYPNSVDHDDLAETRAVEQAASLTALGVDRRRIHRMGVVDGHVADREHDVVAAIVDSAVETTTVIAPWTGDVHPDHEAVGRAARDAADRTGCTVWFSLFWAWHHIEPDALDDVPLLGVAVAAVDEARKATAIGHHRSQLAPVGTEPILGDSVLEPASWSTEFFIPYIGTRRG